MMDILLHKCFLPEKERFLRMAIRGAINSGTWCVLYSVIEVCQRSRTPDSSVVGVNGPFLRRMTNCSCGVPSSIHSKETID